MASRALPIRSLLPANGRPLAGLLSPGRVGPAVIVVIVIVVIAAVDPQLLHVLFTWQGYRIEGGGGELGSAVAAICTSLCI